MPRIGGKINRQLTMNQRNTLKIFKIANIVTNKLIFTRFKIQKVIILINTPLPPALKLLAWR